MEPAIEHLAAAHTVLAPDLLGHGESAKPRGDYSLGAYASAVRDIMVALGHDRATVVGHSLGGGIAMQFAYQFPERTERLVLVSSGGLGREVHPLLRRRPPGSELVLPLLTHPRVLATGAAVGRAIGLLPAGRHRPRRGRARLQLARRRGGARGVHRDHARGAHPGGQRVSALDRLYLAESVPSLLVRGEADPVIPVAHGRAAHAAMPGSRFEVFEGVGHFPQLERPYEFARLLADFIAATEAAELDLTTIRDRLLAGAA